MKVWALFSVELFTNYQPNNNLEKLYRHKPTFLQLIDYIFDGETIEELQDSQIINVANILKGDRESVGFTEWRIEEVEVQE